MTRKKLETEIQKREPFASSEQAIVLNVLRTNELLQHRFGQLFRTHRLTQPQYNILRILRGEGGPLPCLEIAQRMVSVVPAITHLVDRLEKAGLIRRSRSEADRRVIYIDLTRAGRKRLEAMDDQVMALHHELVGHMSRKDQKKLIDLLEIARAAVSA